MPISNQQVLMLDLHCSRQENVCVTPGVSEKVIDDDCEQVVSRKTSEYLCLIWCAGRRIGGVDKQHLDWRIIYVEEVFAETLHIQCADRRRSEIVARQSRPVQTKKSACI